MKAFILLVVLMSCQQLLAAKHASFKEFKKAHADHTNDKLAKLKEKLAKEFEDAPDMVIPEFMKTESFEEMKARLDKMPREPLPDFASRKATLKGLRAKLEDIRKTAMEMDKPDRAFFEEMKKTLAETMDPKITPLQLPELNEAEKEVVVKTKTVGVEVEPKRFVENFGEEIYAAHTEASNTQRTLLTSTRDARSYMVDQVFNVFGSMVFDLARATSGMMEMRNQVQDQIDWLESVGAAAGCVDLQKSNFAGTNYYYGQEMNRCANFAYYPARRYMNTIFYPYLDYTVNEINSLHYVVLNMMYRANLARDQESLLNVLDTLNWGEGLRFNLFATEVLIWEGNGFADAHISFIDYMQQCGQSLIDRYTMATEYILFQLSICPIPTKNE